MKDNPDKQIMRDFGQRYKRLRKNKSFTQAHVAIRLKVENSTISRIECGKQNVSLTLIYKLAAAIDVPACSLLG